MIKREWGAENNGKLSSYSIPCKIASLVHEFAVKDLPSAELLPRFALAVKDLPLGRISNDDDDDDGNDLNKMYSQNP